MLLTGITCPQATAGQPGDVLLARYLSVKDQLSRSAFQRPVILESREAEDELKGDIYAVMDQPFEKVRQALQNMDHWCDILILHLNVKNCRVVNDAAKQSLIVSIGKKHDEPLDKAFPVEFSFLVAVATDSDLRIRLHAETGPLGTKNYQIAFEAVPLDAGKTFIHLAYSYDYGLTARLAMKGYLTTIGSGKVGFSVVEPRPEGEPVLISGVRAVVERNTMRYYLAVESYLGSLNLPLSEQLESRLHSWFAATEQYRRQLHEMDETEYLEMKHKEVLRQHTGDSHAAQTAPSNEPVKTSR